MQTTSITIQNRTFVVPQPYAEGHVLTAGEASALNQVLAENLRNNFASQIKRAAEDKENPRVLEQADLDKYAESYKFGVRTGGTKVIVDPVLKEATKMAEVAVKNALKKRGTDLKTVSDENFDELVQGVLAKNPTFMEQAKIIVAARAGAVGDIDI